MRYEVLSLALIAFTSASTAFGDHYSDTRGDLEVRRLAAQLESDTSTARYEAERYAYRGDLLEEEAIRNLQRAEVSTRNFRLVVDQVTFRTLNVDFARAERSFYNLTAYNYNQHLFERLTSNMRALRIHFRAPDDGGFDRELVLRLSSEADMSANRALRAAELEARYGGPIERQAILHLNRLAQTASQYRLQLERSYQDPLFTERAFRVLEQTLIRAETAVRQARFSQFVQRDLSRVRTIVLRLRAYYGHDRVPGHPGGGLPRPVPRPVPRPIPVIPR